MDSLDDVIADVLGVAPTRLADAMTPEDLPVWDSLNHMRLITAVEEEFDVSFTMSEIESIQSIGRLRELVAGKGGDE
jgi:acyl carrier protein